MVQVWKTNHYYFKIWPTNHFLKAKSYNFHFHKNIVTRPLSAKCNNGLFPNQGRRDWVNYLGNAQPPSRGAKHWLVHNPCSLCPANGNTTGSTLLLGLSYGFILNIFLKIWSFSPNILVKSSCKRGFFFLFSFPMIIVLSSLLLAKLEQ